MKIEIDTINKTILVKESVNVETLIDKLKEMNIDLSEYQLKTDVIYYNNYNNPITMPYLNNTGTGIPNQIFC